MFSLQPPLNYSLRAGRKTLCKTQLWGRESRGQRVCGKPVSCSLEIQVSTSLFKDLYILSTEINLPPLAGQKG